MNAPTPPRALATRLRGWMDGPVGVVAGAVAYGGWALYVNWPAGATLAARSALAHGALSAVLTASGTGTMRRLFAFGRSPRARATLAAGGGLAFTYAVLFATHWAVGTAHVLQTLAPGVVANVAFCVGYVTVLGAADARP